jgi:hypothetical protein
VTSPSLQSFKHNIKLFINSTDSPLYTLTLSNNIVL